MENMTRRCPRNHSVNALPTDTSGNCAWRLQIHLTQWKHPVPGEVQPAIIVSTERVTACRVLLQGVQASSFEVRRLNGAHFAQKEEGEIRPS
jgi:hypothetical protein